MSFDLVPADFVIKIFHQLPLKDRVRLSGVNRLFRDISMESIAKMKSLIVNKDLETYLLREQTLWSLLDTCSPTLESNDVSSDSCSQPFLNTLLEFCYPKLKHLEIRVSSENIGQMKMLISRNRNLRSVILHLSCEFEWPADIAFEKMEKLEILLSWRTEVSLSPTLRLLIGNISNLKHLTIKSGVSHPRIVHITLPAQELSQLMASIPSLEQLYLDVSFGHGDKWQDVVASVPNWHLPKVATLHVDLNKPTPSSILRRFPFCFPRVELLTSIKMEEIIDLDIFELSKAKYLQELRLPSLKTTKDTFSMLTNSIPSITVLHINKTENEALQALSQLEHLREFYMNGMIMKKAQVIDVITIVPLISVLGICKISDGSSSQKFIDFLTSTAASFLRHLEIRMTGMSVSQINSELENALEAMVGQLLPMRSMEILCV